MSKLNKTEEPNVYFTDPKTGEVYISSPECDFTFEIVTVVMIAMTSPFWIGATLWLTLYR